MARLIYNLLWPVGLIFFLPGYLVKMVRRGNYRAKFGQRVGWYGSGLRRQLAHRQSIWLHAVSVGEVGIALKLAAEMRNLHPDLHCILTTTTTTGFAFAGKSAPPWMEVMYNPVDFWPIVRHAFSVLKPARIVLIEAEIWPNLVAEAHARKIPIALANARLSPRSQRRFRRFRRFVAPTFRLLDLVCVQEQEDADRWAALGVDRSRIHCTGSIKFDPGSVSIDPAVPRTVLDQLKVDANRPVLLGGSTHPGEEIVLAGIYKEIRAQFPHLFLVIAPRHAERGREVQRVVEQLGLRVGLRSQQVTDQTTDCLVLDTTGELRNWYAVATIVFMGKSLSAHGGQNPAEAIAAGKPVLFGAHMENFAALARSLVEQGGAIQARDRDELKEAIVNLLRDGSRRDELSRQASGVLEKHRCATERAAKLILGLA
jgi:3-deoxy-D-manno-octulosonic-acid transferase